jgi:hypothetical protein
VCGNGANWLADKKTLAIFRIRIFENDCLFSYASGLDGKNLRTSWFAVGLVRKPGTRFAKRGSGEPNKSPEEFGEKAC